MGLNPTKNIDVFPSVIFSQVASTTHDTTGRWAEIRSECPRRPSGADTIAAASPNKRVYLKRLQILDHLTLLFLAQFEPERMALIAQAGQRRVDDSSPGLSRRVFRRGRAERLDLQSQILRVIFFGPADATEILRTGFGGQYAVNGRHGAVVEVRPGGPHAVERRRDVAGRIFVAAFAPLAEPRLSVIVTELFCQLGQT